VIAILRQVCASLEEAHGRGLIHRDIKPANIMLCERGGRSDVVKVLDFGLVKDLGNETELNLTRSDAITGTPLWVSPEAVAGPDRIEPRSDLYGVGAVGYFLLTGTPVFRGANAWLVCMKHMRQKPEPPSARSEGPVPADLEQVILDCLAKRPDLRPAGAADLADRLAACADAGGWTPERASQWWREHADQLAPSDEGADAVQALSVDLADRKTPPRAL
jgi:serine/threonine-protein kinase